MNPTTDQAALLLPRSPAPGPVSNRASRSAVMPLATLLMGMSGFAGLDYQIVWTEQFGVWLGHDIVAVLAVIAAFFGGLALGALALTRRISCSAKPALWYAGCGAVTGAWAILLTWILPSANAWLGMLLSFPKPNNASANGTETTPATQITPRSNKSLPTATVLFATGALGIGYEVVVVRVLRPTRLSTSTTGRLSRTTRPSSLRAMLTQRQAPLLAIVRSSADFRPAYDPLLNLAQALAHVDRPAARSLLTDLVTANRARPEAAAQLRRLGADLPEGRVLP